MRFSTVVSANYLERVADPRSRFHGDYLAYRKGQINHRQLMSRLPHMAMIGDSLSCDAYVCSPLSMVWRARRRKDRGWFLDRNPSAGRVHSIFERLEKLTPLVAINYSGMGALVDSEGEKQWLSRKILGTGNFSAQTRRVVSAARFPDLILIWIGHNNVDWAWQCPPDELENPENRLQKQSERFRRDYARQMRSLIERARGERHRVVFMVYGLADFESFFKARDIAEELRKRDPTLYPYLGSDVRYFISMRHAYRRNLVRLVRLANEELRAMVEKLASEVRGASHIQVNYSDALARTDLSRVEVIHAVDGWHPSAKGHNAFADAAFGSLRASLQFLGITSGYSPRSFSRSTVSRSMR
jgi:lysophospholipase L1-like esterase